MKPFSVYLTEEVGSVESYLKEFGDAVASTHERFDEKGHTFFIPLKFDRSLPNKMIMAALQGDGTATVFETFMPDLETIPVPAPGALALGGLSILTGGRRRRS